jgi:predicted YcjX-like family ATPase
VGIFVVKKMNIAANLQGLVCQISVKMDMTIARLAQKAMNVVGHNRTVIDAMGMASVKISAKRKVPFTVA